MKILTFVMLALAVDLAPSVQSQKPVPPAPAKCTFHGRIYDPMGAVIVDAFALLHSNRLVKLNLQIPITKSGEFELHVDPGLYDFFVASPGFAPQARVIDLRSCKPIDLRVKMQVDSEHLEADRF